MARVSLEEKANSWVRHLSGGQKQRLAMACALVGDPELLFLDEPTTGLDPQSRRQLWDIIREFRDSGRTVLLTTHYMDEAERLCDRVAIVDHGKVIALGTPRELIASLGGEHVIEFTLEQTGTASSQRGATNDQPEIGADQFARSCRPSAPPAPKTATSACRPANRTSPCRRSWRGWNRSIAGSPA